MITSLYNFYPNPTRLSFQALST